MGGGVENGYIKVSSGSELNNTVKVTREVTWKLHFIR